MSFDAQFSPDKPNPYAASGGPAPKKSSMTWLYILLGVLGVCALGCCGCIGMAYWGFQTGMGELANQVKSQAAANAVVQEQLGEVQSVSIDLIASATETEKAGPGQKRLVFSATGSKGSGTLIATEGAPGRLELLELRTSSGEAIPLNTAPPGLPAP